MPRAASLAPLTRGGRVGRFALLIGGLLLYGLSLRLMIDARIGVAPWEVLHLGLSRVLPLTVGQASIGVGALLLAYTSFGLRERVGLGTLFNVLLIGIFLDVFGPLVPDPVGWPRRAAQFAAGVALLGLATGAYVGAGLGAGPRDGLMLGLNRRYGWPVARIRTVVELVVLLLGALLGGPVGWGTLAFALLVGHSVSFGLSLFGVRGSASPGAMPRRPLA